MTALTERGSTLARLPAGFADPVIASQGVFRSALAALSLPGRSQVLAEATTGPLAPPAGLSAALAALLLVLLDGETTLWLAPSLDDDDLGAWLGFHTGVRRVARPQEAAFVAARAGDVDLALWRSLDRGSDERPQDGATLLIDVESLDRGRALTLSGPGIAGRARLSVTGVAPEVWSARAAESAHYPLGVDLLLCEGRRLAGVPRSTRVMVEA